MKFCKRYEEYMMKKRTEKEELPRVGLKKLKKVLRRCRSTDSQHLPTYGRDDGGERPDGAMDGGCGATATSSNCPDHCAVCDGTFFPPLLVEMAAIVGCFNDRAQKLLELHLTSGFKKYFLWMKNKQQKDHGVLVQEGKDLITYAIINSIAMRKILKKYDKIHYSNQGQAFRSRARRMHIEILQSPWLCQLMALYINIRESTVKNKAIPGLFLNCSLIITDDKPMLSCGLFDSMKVDINLTCSICLDTVFDPISLRCGHIFCYMCCCSAASVSIVDGLKAVNRKEKCPLCRQEGVYKGAVHLDELNILLSRSFPDYWDKRLQTERVERLRQVKEHWESQCRSFMGI